MFYQCHDGTREGREGDCQGMTLPFNVGIAVYCYRTEYFDKLMQVKIEVEKALIAKFGKEAFEVTRIKKSEKYENYSIGFYIVVPEKTEMHVELKETKDNASSR